MVNKIDTENFLYFNLNAGVSGDMLIAALVDLGVPLSVLKNNLKKIDPKISLDKVKVTRGPLECTLIEPYFPPNLINSKFSWDELFSLIKPFEKDLEFYENLYKTLSLIRECEGLVHGPKNSIPHELGSIDTIFDIVGFYSCIKHLGYNQVFSSGVPFPQGNISIDHGAVSAFPPVGFFIVKKIGVPLFALSDKANFEYCTPTGLSLLKNFNFNNFSPSKIVKSGFGAGQADFENYSNSISVSIMAKSKNQLEKLFTVDTNIDDMSPEIIPYVMEKVLEIGAKDVWCTNIMMKKNRPAIMISVLCDQGVLDQVISIIKVETSTLGVRISQVDREKFNRDQIEVSTQYGKVKVKLKLSDENSIIGYHPEYEDCKNLAKMHNIPLKVIFEEAINESKKVPR